MPLIAQVKGGLGNQLFIYAAARAISLNNGVPLFLDVFTGYRGDRFNRRFLLDEFNISASISREYSPYCFFGMKTIPLLLSKINRLLPIKKRYVIREQYPKFDPEMLQPGLSSTYLIGYWQSYLYFSQIASQIKEELVLKSPLDMKNIQMGKEILSSESVSVHIRQGNLSNKLSEDYYRLAVQIINSKVKNPRYFVFSDSPESAAKLSAILPKQQTIVGINSDQESYKDLWLMSRCRHHIIANSTFSWWGGWLSDNERKVVVAPESIQKFNADILPPDWIVI